jgi:cupin fold WbuC family metalloprotein
MMKKNIDIDFIKELWTVAAASPRLRMNYDMRNSSEDTSQRMLNALLPGTVVPIHKHETTDESVMCLCGKIECIFYDECAETYKEIAKCTLCPNDGNYGIQIPAGMWHTVNVLEPSVIFEAKDGMYAQG